MELTEEQKAVIAYDPSESETVRVIAFAGTGKTTTLVEYTNKRPNLRFLYIAFNKSVQNEAQARFPKNVTCKTAHSLAWQKFGAQNRNRLVPGLRANIVSEVLGLGSFEEAKFVIDTVSRFMASTDTRITKKHVPNSVWHYYKGRPVPDFEVRASMLWHLIISGEDARIGMLHDAYLKLFQLSQPNLNYDIILLDEAQDVNPVIADIVKSQNRPKIFVGDPHQQIYSFRGANNSMDSLGDCRTFYLTRSFRFGGSVATVANMILSTFKGERKSLVGAAPKKNQSDFQNFAYIARTNASVFDEAVKLYKKHQIGFVGGVESYRFNIILDVYYLYCGELNKIRDLYLRKFNTLSALKKYAKSVDDRELGWTCKIVEKYGSKIPEFVREITASVSDLNKADVILTTAHKSKGLEFDMVRLADDFPPLVKGGKIIGRSDLDPDEFNLIYVAVTRARNELKVIKGSSLMNFIVKFRANEAALRKAS